MNAELSELASHCIRCGFCLESCPTFLVTGEETESPRGRIYLARGSLEGRLDWRQAAPHLDACLGCRGCETACPSGVQYGQIVELAREEIAARRAAPGLRLLLGMLTRPGVLRRLGALGRRLPGARMPRILGLLFSNEPPVAGLPVAQWSGMLPPLDETLLMPITGQAFILDGCAMGSLFPRVQEASARLLRRVGLAPKRLASGCCGALHAHSGYVAQGAAMARRVLARLPENDVLVATAAGCGSWLKEQAHGKRRVLDLSELLHENGLGEALKKAPGYWAVATYHDACHLAHAQGIRSQPRELITAIPGLTLLPMPESDLCCGSGGISNLTHPSQAVALQTRKLENAQATGASLLIQGNPGCHLWLAPAAKARGLTVLHTAEALEAAFIGLEWFCDGAKQTAEAERT
ncbi:MAG: (Fe-S)-binding protein [Fimbriimonas ginsengisoli]|uniref:Glycolate oxidase iron-sulfur subunit n=1 Tax=Fimbriimonas ginsengisoli TaxID=1005039 RepID=A0A931M0N7_FIMGI|nr:(Fe-S)-binding protein [Fimbriimonas ginsengisoli]